MRFFQILSRRLRARVATLGDKFTGQIEGRANRESRALGSINKHGGRPWERDDLTRNLVVAPSAVA